VLTRQVRSKSGTQGAAHWATPIANLLSAIGYKVEREYYINDVTMSTQVQNFGESLEARYLQLLGYDVPFPEEGYKGEYVIELAREIVNEYGDAFVNLPPEERRAQVLDLARGENCRPA